MSIRIYDENDIEHYFERGEITRWDSESIYYDPDYNTFHYHHGSQFDPRKFYTTVWFRNAKFEFINGDPYYLPEQDPSYKSDRSRSRQSNSHMTNFLILGTMSTCGRTKLNDANRPIALWKDQQECSFAVKSTESPHCMFWSNRVVDAHCDCHEAYDQKMGSEVSLERIATIKERDVEIDKKKLYQKGDKYFRRAEKVHIDTLQNLHDKGLLVQVTPATPQQTSVFYYKDWDVFFNGNGQFLREMTTKRRKSGKEPKRHAEQWIGPLAIIGEDNSGTIDPIEMHEFLHEIAKLRFDDKPDPIMWDIDIDRTCNIQDVCINTDLIKK